MNKRMNIVVYRILFLFTPCFVMICNQDTSQSSESTAHHAVMNTLKMLTESLAHETYLYKNWKNSLELLHHKLSTSEQVHNDILESIYASIDDLAVSHVATYLQLPTKQHRNSYEQHLLQQLEELKLETETKLEYLNYLVKYLSEELARIYNTHNEQIELDKKRSQELMQELLIIYEYHDTMIQQRADFVKTFNVFISFIQNYISKTIDNLEKIELHVCSLDDEE